MFVVRDVFQCKPGQSKALAEKFTQSLAVLKKSPSFHSGRVLVDFVASYWTVVFEVEVQNLDEFEKAMQGYASGDEMQQIMKGYMDFVVGGHREIFRIM